MVETLNRPASKDVLEIRSSIASVLDLPEKLAQFPENERMLVEKLFEISRKETTPMVIPEEMKPGLIRSFGNGRTPEETLELLRNQPLLMIRDRYLKAMAVYNPLRRKRPQPQTESAFQRDIDDPQKKANCPFCDPEHLTPYDSEIGRSSGDGVVTAANITKFAGDHELALGAHNPYETTYVQFIKQLDVLAGNGRIKSINDPSKKFLRIGLNRGYRAAGSQVHDHWQGELWDGSMHFPHAEEINEASFNDYRGEVSDGVESTFLEDYYRVHEILGLGIQRGEAKVISMLTPKKEHGVMIIDDTNREGFYMSPDFKDALWLVQQYMIAKEGVREYNVFILPKPNNPDSPEHWAKYKGYAIFTDRGQSTTQNSDMGYAEGSGTSVLSFDPFVFAPGLNDYLLTH
ncbi:MAG: hypothetical protein M1450_02365 [Patescibacteria group bacterium]|nr:hypothetical protein [Patescibacteria group bacterium]